MSPDVKHGLAAANPASGEEAFSQILTQCDPPRVPENYSQQGGSALSLRLPLIFLHANITLASIIRCQAKGASTASTRCAICAPLQTAIDTYSMALEKVIDLDALG